MATPKRRRPVVGTSGLGQSPLQVAATPVNRERATDGGRNLRQLAEGLAKFSPTLSRLHDVTLARQGEADKKAGEQRARELWEEGKTFKQAVEDGLISRAESPWFRVGAEEFFGRQAATEYQAFLRERLRESPVRNSTEVGDFDEFEREVRKEFVEGVLGEGNRTISTALSNSFGRTAQAIVANERNAFSAQAGARLEQQTEDAFHSTVMTSAMAISSGDMTWEEARTAIQTDLQRMIEMGTTDKGALNRIAAEGIVNAARRANDKSILQLLREIETVPGSTLETAKDVTDLIEAGEREINAQLEGEQRQANYEADRRRSEFVRVRTGQIMQEMIENGPAGVANFDSRAAEIAQYNPAAAASLYSARTALLSNMNINDPEEVDSLILGIYSGENTDLRPAIDAMSAGLISQQGLNTYMQHLSQVQSTSGGRNAINDPAFKTDAFRDAEDRLFRELGATRMDLGDNEEVVQRALGFLRRRWYDQYHRGGKDKGYNDQITQLDNMVDVLLETYKPEGSRTLSADESPVGPGGPNDPLYIQQAVMTPEVYTPMAERLSASGMRGLTRQEFQLLQALGVEFVQPASSSPEDVAAAQAQTMTNIREAIRQQEFLYRLTTSNR